jgi:peroxiredoxin
VRPEVPLLLKRTALLFLFAAALPVSLALSQQIGGIQPGATAPAISLQDQKGRTQTLSTLAGPNGLLLLFFRSADWCPFCKGQLVDLEGAQKAFAAKGINVAAVSYDSQPILADFARRRSITYPLLSDRSSRLIDAFGIRNRESTGIEAGIPYPGYYLIDPQGTIQRRFFETAYVNRLTANNLYQDLFGEFAIIAPSRTLDATPHVTLATTQSDTSVTPGQILKLAVELTPGPDTHVYAPGAEKLHYHAVSLSIAPSELYRSSATSYPKSEMLHFAELNETAPVYNGKTVFTTNVAAVVNQQTIPVFATSPELPIKGTFNYQACTSTVCFPPVSVPVAWTVHFKKLDLERAPDAIQHK